MADFETQGALEIVLSNKREVERELEELGPKEFEVDVSGTGKGSAGRRERESIRLDRTRNDLLRAILDELDGGLTGTEGDGDGDGRPRRRNSDGGGGGGGIAAIVASVLGATTAAGVASAASSGAGSSAPDPSGDPAAPPPDSDPSGRGGPGPVPVPDPEALKRREPTPAPNTDPSGTPEEPSSPFPDIPLPSPAQALGGTAAALITGAGLKGAFKGLGPGTASSGAGFPVVSRGQVPEGRSPNEINNNLEQFGLPGVFAGGSDNTDPIFGGGDQEPIGLATSTGRENLVGAYTDTVSTIFGGKQAAPTGGGTASTVAGPGSDIGSGQNVQVTVNVDARGSSTESLDQKIDRKMEQAKREAKKEAKKELGTERNASITSNISRGQSDRFDTQM